jgi:hypothetical protein
LQDSSEPMVIRNLASGAFEVTMAATYPFNTSSEAYQKTFACGVGSDGNVIDLNCPLTDDAHTCDHATNAAVMVVCSVFFFLL